MELRMFLLQFLLVFDLFFFQSLKMISRALDISKDDEVVVPSNICIVTSIAKSSVGGIPISVESDIDTYNIYDFSGRQ